MFKTFIFVILTLVLVIIVLFYDIKGDYFYKDPQWVITIIALIVGVASIFQGYIISWFWKPELQLSISLTPTDGDCHQIPVISRIYASVPTEIPNSITISEPHYFFNLRVKNIGNHHAENIEVAILELYKKEENGFTKIHFPPMNLSWRHEQGKIVVPRIAPFIDTHFTLGHISQVNSSPDYCVIFELEPIVHLTTNPHILLPGEYQIKIGLVASNISNPLIKIYNLRFKNEWSDKEQEMLTKNIFITEIGDV